MNKKANAYDFIMTYGWIILFVLTVAALVYFDVFRSGKVINNCYCSELHLNHEYQLYDYWLCSEFVNYEIIRETENIGVVKNYFLYECVNGGMELRQTLFYDDI